MIVVKRGSTRTVLLIGKVVVKVPSTREWRLFLRGLLANMQERQRWNGTRDARLAQVLWADPLGFVLIMERVSPLPRGFRKYHLNWLLGRGRFDGLPMDPHLGNFGFRGRSLVLIDYGN